MHCLGTLYFDYISRERLVEQVRRVNPNYKITYVVGGDTGAHPNNVLVAKP